MIDDQFADDPSTAIPVISMLPIQGGGITVAVSGLEPVTVFEKMTNPESFWNDVNRDELVPWGGIWKDDLVVLAMGGRGWRLQTYGEWRILDENFNFLASRDCWRTPGEIGLFGARVKEISIVPDGEISDLFIKFSDGRVFETFTKNNKLSWRFESVSTREP